MRCTYKILWCKGELTRPGAFIMATGAVEGGASGHIEHLDSIKTLEAEIKKSEAALTTLRRTLEDKSKNTPAAQAQLTQLNEELTKLQEKRRAAIASLTGGTADNLRSLAQATREKAPEVKFEVKRYIDQVSGFAVQAYVPQGFNGALDIYFSGDGHTNDRTAAEMRIPGQAQAKWKTGARSAIVVIEGDKNCLYKNTKQRYASLKKNGVFSGILSGLEKQLSSKVKTVHILGWSRGEEAVRNILLSGEARGAITAISLLDATYGNPQAFIDFAKRGGRVNVAYQPRPSARTEAQARTIDRQVGMLSNVRVVAAHGMTHREISQQYLGRFIGGEYPAGAPGAPAASPSAAQEKPADQKVEAYGEEKLKEFLDAFDERKGNDAQLKEFSAWARKQKDVEVLRRAQTSIEEDAKNPDARHVKLAAEYLTTLPDKKNGHISFGVDFKGNEVAEWKVFGAGHLLPDTVQAIRVYDSHGVMLFDNAQRAVRRGRIGYFDAKGRYAYIHSGYTIEVLSAQDIKAEREKEHLHFEQDERTITVKAALVAFLKSKNLEGIEVDDRYFAKRLHYIGQKSPANYGQKEFNEVFEKEFAADMTLLINLNNLRNQGAHEKIYLRDVPRYREDPRCAALRAKVLDIRELATFQQEKLAGKDVSDFTIKSNEVTSNESFAQSMDDFGTVVTLRKSAMQAFENAKRIAASMGVKLKVNSSYRTLAQQTHLHHQGCQKHGTEGVKKWVATPGGSPHHTGGTVDIAAYMNSGKRAPKQYLAQIMTRAGFVNYRPEPWHWEIYTTRWKKISGLPGPVYAKAMKLPS